VLEKPSREKIGFKSSAKSESIGGKKSGRKRVPDGLLEQTYRSDRPLQSISLVLINRSVDS